MQISDDTVSAAVALVMFTVFAALGFGWRSWVQHRAAASTGFRGISGRVGPLEWTAGVGFVVAIVAAVAAPVLQLAGMAAPIGALHAGWLQWSGIALAAAGIAGTVYAQLDLGESWRVGASHGEPYRQYTATVGRFVPGVGVRR
jgi:protein-S-isoprenylcysteine O-methyltransferase Ste14